MIFLPFIGKITISSKYGWRTLNGSRDFHRGLDLVALEDKTIYSPCSSTVIMSAYYREPRYVGDLTWQWGNFVCLQPLDNPDMKIFLCHMKERFVQYGELIDAGQPIGIMGNTGYSFGEHTHMEVRINNEAINPCGILGIEDKCYTLTNKELYFEMTDKQLRQIIDERIEKYFNSLKKKEVPNWAKKELQEAINMGITDGSRGMDYATRMETAIMVKRAAANEKEK